MRLTAAEEEKPAKHKDSDAAKQLRAERRLLSRLYSRIEAKIYRRRKRVKEAFCCRRERKRERTTLAAAVRLL
jgi:hypothetical protein